VNPKEAIFAMHLRRFRHLLAAAALAVSCTFVAGGASADVEQAKTFVEREHGKLKTLVEANAPSDDVRKAIDNMVDYDQLAMRTLGKPCPTTVPSCTNHWDALTPEQRTEVTGLLRKLVEKNYHKNLNKTREYDISYRGAKDQGDNVSKIKTEAKSKAKPRDPAVQVDYVILGSGDHYRVIDIVTEGSSMTKNYYDQFHRMLTTEGQGYTYLVQKLRDKIAAKDKEAAAEKK
jgi:phospholipid transport system substrate-binding protein